MGKKILFTLLTLSCILIGLYPIRYFFGYRTFGLLQTKTPELLLNSFWNIGFYGHIIFGGISLLIGWIQFSRWVRNNHINIHRTIGKIYVVSAFISGICGVAIGATATGGLVCIVGFMLGGVIWLFTTYKAYSAIKVKNFKRHEAFMILSYAMCFAAVTLRIWLPLLGSYYEAFLPAYKIVSWISWLPNLLLAYYYVIQKKLLV
jgi:hypothetical protein